MMTPNRTEEALAELVVEVRRLRQTVAAAAVVLAGDFTGSGSKAEAVKFLNRARTAGMTDG